MNEYLYLRNLAYDRFEADFQELTRRTRREIDRVKSEIPAPFQKLEIEILEVKRELLAYQLFQTRMRAESIIHWLKTDSQLRQDGFSYPDQCEKKVVLDYVTSRKNCC